MTPGEKKKSKQKRNQCEKEIKENKRNKSKKEIKTKKKSKQKRHQSKKVAFPDGKRARLAEAEMAAGLQDHLHLRDKTHLEMSRIWISKKTYTSIHLASPFHFVLLQKLAWTRVHGP